MIENNYLTLKNRATAVYKLIMKHQKKNYPIPYLNDLFVELETIYTMFIKKYFASEDGLEISAGELFKINRFINTTNELVLATLNNASTINNPKAITIPIKEKLEKSNGSAVYVPELIWMVNYYVGEISGVYNRIVKSIGLDSSLGIHLYRFGIPHFYQDDVLMSGIIGHELGHYFDLYGGLDISEKILAKLTNDSNFIDSLLQFVVCENNETLDTGSKQEVVKMFLIQHHMKNWIREFIADVLGIVFYGPASFFASERLIQSVNFNNEDIDSSDLVSITHPCNLLRLNIKKLALKKMGYDNLPDPFVSEIEKSTLVWERASRIYNRDVRIIGKVRGKNVGFDANPASLSLIEEYLSTHFEYIIEFCLSEVPEELVYHTKAMEDSIEILANKLGQLLPPNELHHNVPSDSISIINAGWLAYFLPSQLLISKYKNNDELLEAINNMLIRSLEVASIHRRWIDVDTE